MKVIFDIDGTLTDFNKFIKNNAIDYFEKKYGMSVKYPNKLEVEDIFDMDNFFAQKYNCSKTFARNYTNEALKKFWVNLPRFLKFSLLGRFRSGVSYFLNYCKSNGDNIEIHTSRSKTTDNSVIGAVARKFTYLQFLMNGVSIPYDSIYFYKNDVDKIEGIKQSNPDVVFDDKPEVLNELNKYGLRTICIDGLHNKEVEETDILKKLYNYNLKEVEETYNELFGKKTYEVLNRISKSDLFYKKARMVIPFILSKFNPIVLHEENIIKDDSCGKIIAPNHSSTIDPLILTSIIDTNIHWAALKRFFDGNDSIFNNNKNSVLCKITSTGFKKLEYFPIERLRDNPHANNLNSLKDMQNFIKNKQYIGIFPEGTTRKEEGADFGVFDPTFIHFAKKSDAWIQPITLLWIKDLNLSNKVIVNFGTPFKVQDMTKEEAYQKYLNIQECSLKENKEYANNLKNDKNKSLKKV